MCFPVCSGVYWFRSHRCRKMRIIHGIYDRCFVVVCFQRIRFFSPYYASLQYVPQEYAPVLRLFHRHLAVCTVRLTLPDPVKPLAVLGRYQRRVDKHRLHT